MYLIKRTSSLSYLRMKLPEEFQQLNFWNRVLTLFQALINNIN